MSNFPITTYRLAPRGPGSRGLVCDREGAMLGPAPLISPVSGPGGRRVFQAVAAERLGEILKAAYGPDFDLALAERTSQLQAIARALTENRMADALIGAVHLRLPELSEAAVQRLAALAKYSPDQPRVPKGNPDGGQWTREGGAGGNAAGPVRPSRSLAQLISYAMPRSPSRSASAFSNPGQTEDADVDATPISISQDNTPVQLQDDQGRDVQRDDHTPIRVPRGVDIHFFVDQGLADKQALEAATSGDDLSAAAARIAVHLSNFRDGGPWDLQRADGKNMTEFRDVSTVAIGLYAASLGLNIEDILTIENDYAGYFSRFGNAEMDETYTHLPKLNVENTRRGYELFYSGKIGPTRRG